MTENPTLKNLKEIIDKHWHILNINPEYRETLKISPIIAFRKNVFLKQITGTIIVKNKKIP